MTNKNLKLLNAFTLAEGGHSPLLYGDEGVAEGYSCVETKGGRSPLLSGDEGTQGSPRLGSRRLLLYATKGAQGSPHLEVIGKSHDAKINVKISLSSGERISVRTER